MPFRKSVTPRSLLGLICGLALPLSACARHQASVEQPGSKQSGSSPERKKIVLIAGNKSHGPEGNGMHEYPASVRLLKVMLDTSNIADRVAVHTVFGAWPDEAVLEGAATIMVISDGRDNDKFQEAEHLASPATIASWTRHMQRGAGFLTFHFSTFAPDSQAEAALAYAGGYFDWETDDKTKWYSAITTLPDAEIEVQEPSHPTLRGIGTWRMGDEFYYNLRFRPNDPGLQKLLSVPDLPGREPDGRVVTWARNRENGGRSFGTTMGHRFENWEDDNFRKLILNAIAWTAGVDVPEGGVKARYFSRDEVNVALRGLAPGQPAQPEKPITTLILTGDDGPFHHWPDKTEVLKLGLEMDRRVVVHVTEDIEQLATLKLSDYDVLVLNYSNWHSNEGLSAASKQALVEYLQSGGGLSVIHFSNGAWNGTLPFARGSDWPEYRNIVARVWMEGTSGHDSYGNFAVQVESTEHPITEGMRGWNTTDELYHSQVGTMRITPLVTAMSRSTGKREPLAWTTSYGKGRVFQTLLGHGPDALATGGTAQLIRRGTVWAAGKPQRTLGPLPIVWSPVRTQDPERPRWSEKDEPPDARYGAWALPAKDAVFLAESPEAREEQLPAYLVIPPAPTSQLTPSLHPPDPAEHVNWYRAHGDAASTRYSRLKQIDRNNVARLKVAWTYHSGDEPGNIQANPTVVDGVMYAPTSGRNIVAISADTGKELWRFHPEQGSWPPARRGLVYWGGDAQHGARLLFSSANFLYALDPKTGKPVTAFGENGVAVLPSQSVASPVLWQDTLIMAGFDKDVWAFDARSGRQLWTFHTIPRDGESFRDTWDKPDQGANCWGGVSVDKSRGIAYVATGSPKPNVAGSGHLGRNLYGNAVIALDARTGERLWYFQDLRHDIWDLDLPAPPILASITRQGRKVDVVVQLSKTGTTLVLDRVTGKTLYPFRLRRAPASKAPGERTWPYQPDPQIPVSFSPQVFDPSQVTDLTDEKRETTLAHLNETNHGWYEAFEPGKPTVYWGVHGGAEWTGGAFDPENETVYISTNRVAWQTVMARAQHGFVDESRLPQTRGRKIFLQFCAPCHGQNREGVAVNPPLLGLGDRLNDAQVSSLLTTGRKLMPPAPPMSERDRKALLDYVFERDRKRSAKAAAPASDRPLYYHAGFVKLLDDEGYPATKPPWGQLVALNVGSGQLKWAVPLGEYKDLTKRGIPITGTENFGGASVTAGGLVFVSGTDDQMIRAFDKETGKQLWQHALPANGSAPPSIYDVGGRQFVVVPAGGGGKLGGKVADAYVAFALPQ